MGDSDDDYDRKRRDKFRGERSVGSDRRRDDWVDSRGRPKTDYRDYRAPRDRSSYSPGRDYPPIKRMRGDYDEPRARYTAHDPYSYGWGGDHYGAHVPPMGYGHMSREHHHREAGVSSDQQTQPCLMTLKQFLATQDDSISDSDAIEKYNEYKVEFRRLQLNEFFVAHKDEEWFKLKYHPEESVKRKEEQLQFLKRRVDVFVELLENNSIAEVSVDTNQSEKLLRVLDTVVIKLEGGTDADIAALDEKTSDAAVAETEGKPAEVTKDTGTHEEAEKKDEESSNGAGEHEESPKRKRSASESSESSSGGDSAAEAKESSAQATPASQEDKVQESSTDCNVSRAITDSEDQSGTGMDVDADGPGKDNDDTTNVDAVVVDVAKDNTDSVTVRDLHKTSSIFLRNLAPTITKAEVEAVCRRYDGFLRVAIADPLVERRWFRRGWVSFRRDVNIKEICWNLNNIRLRDCELGAIVNRDLSRRVRPVNGITHHRTILRNDIKVCAKIVHNLDEKCSLWADEGNTNAENKMTTFGFNSKNPVLQNITDYLIEEGSAEEDELLGLGAKEEEDKAEGEVAGDESFERDSDLISVLDKLILYLRIVHSVDFYNHCEYPYEDEMPNRCGIIHARMPVPTAKVTKQDVQEYIKNFESKIEPFVQRTVSLSPEELKKLGSKDAEQEVEKFITANSQELAKDKWLCPLSGKKFKGPDFIRKHILNKHAEKVEEVRKEVEYFNNYLADSKRPQLPEHPANSKKEGVASRENPMMGFRASYPGPGYGPYGPPRTRGPSGFGQRRPIPVDLRPIIHYRDLDAPREPDEFL